MGIPETILFWFVLRYEPVVILHLIKINWRLFKIACCGLETDKFALTTPPICSPSDAKPSNCIKLFDKQFIYVFGWEKYTIVREVEESPANLNNGALLTSFVMLLIVVFNSAMPYTPTGIVLLYVIPFTTYENAVYWLVTFGSQYTTLACKTLNWYFFFGFNRIGGSKFIRTVDPFESIYLLLAGVLLTYKENII